MEALGFKKIHRKTGNGWKVILTKSYKYIVISEKKRSFLVLYENKLYLCNIFEIIFNDLLTNYERVADHCSNIAVAMIELESDSFDTHEYLNSVKAMKSASFARYSAEYQKKYTL